MDLPIELKNRIEEIANQYSLKELMNTSEIITKRYRDESGRGKRLVSQDLESLVYAIVRMPATYGAISSVLDKSFQNNDLPIKTVLDIGSGTGAGFFACMNYFDHITHYTCIERERSMIKMGKRFMEGYEDIVEWIQKDMNSIDDSIHADLVIASYAMNEMSEENREKLVNKLWAITNQVLIIIEPGTPVGFHEIYTIRNKLLQQSGNLLAPCTHMEKCPIQKEDWCHFTVRIQRSRLHKQIKKADVPYEDEKFSFIAVSKNPVELKGSRILRHPYIEAGRVRLVVCNPSGIEEKMITKKDKEHFKTARKSDAGDLYI